jgi:DNA-binding transcriptional ArsR family regulator
MGSMQARACGDPFEALGDANRREILSLLSEGDKPVGEIAAALPISRPAVSRHLRLLKDAGLVAERAQGTRRIYHLQDQGVQAVQAYLERVWGEAALRFRLLAENTRPAGKTRPAGRTRPAGKTPAANTAAANTAAGKTPARNRGEPPRP